MTHLGCTCIDTSDPDPSCPVHGGDALEGPNRWAAFTDAELWSLKAERFRVQPPNDGPPALSDVIASSLSAEIEAELERRHAT